MRTVLAIIDETAFSIVLQALSFAARKHRDQRRKGSDHAPYINHLIDVLDLLWRVGGVREADVLAAGVLHDTVEDTATTPPSSKKFWSGCSALVLEVTDDKTLPQAVRKRLQIEHAGQLSIGAKLIKLADKISNVRDMAYPSGFLAAPAPAGVPGVGRQVVERLRGTNPALEAEFERVLKEP